MIQKTATSPDAASDSDDDSECSGFGFAALDLTGVNFDEGDGNDADESDALKLSEEDCIALKLEKGLLMTGDYTSLEIIIYSSTKANKEGKTTDPSSSSAQWKRLLNLTELVIDGRYIDALKSPSAQWLLEVEDNDTKNCGDNYDHYFWDRV